MPSKYTNRPENKTFYVLFPLERWAVKYLRVVSIDDLTSIFWNPCQATVKIFFFELLKLLTPGYCVSWIGPVVERWSIRWQVHQEHKVLSSRDFFPLAFISLFLSRLKNIVIYSGTELFEGIVSSTTFSPSVFQKSNPSKTKSIPSCIHMNATLFFTFVGGCGDRWNFYEYYTESNKSVKIEILINTVYSMCWGVKWHMTFPPSTQQILTEL